jgi:hypothetical protein
VANLYNSHHRVGKESQYTWENVCIVPGGRAGLIRIAAVIGMFAFASTILGFQLIRNLGNAYLGFFVSKARVHEAGHQPTSRFLAAVCTHRT